MPPQDLPPGLYDYPLDPAEAPQRLARYLHQLSEIALAALPEAQRQQQQLALVNQIVSLLQQQAPNAITAGHQLHPSARLLQELRASPLLPNESPLVRPLIPLANGTLLINAPSEPSVGLALQAECPSADRIDLLCAFIKWSGLRLLQEQLSAHLNAGRTLRVLTTVYMGATDRKALDWLVDRGAQLRVSTDTRRTRLHAKAWLFHRASGASTAYIGSSNLSAAALLDGLEWNVRLAALETPAMLAKFQSTFEAYWEEGEFEPYAATAEEIGPASGLAAWLEALAMEPAEFYGIRGAGFTALRREIGWLPAPPHPEEERLTRAIATGLLHQGDPNRLRATAAALAAPVPPDPEALGERERRGWQMLFAQLLGTGQHWRPLPWALPVPLRVHGRYSRAEVLAAFDAVDERGAPRSHREGVLWHQPTSTDLLFITLRKSEAFFSPSTRYRDLALGPSLFHWESQSTTTASSPTGQRYIHHAARGSRVLLFVREQRKQGGVTEPFVSLGFATYESHEGEWIWFVTEWGSAGGCSGRSRRRGCTAVVSHTSWCLA